jgi:HemY protein
MKLFAFVLILLFATVLVTLGAVEDPGYVLLARGPWSVEMSLTVFTALALVGFLLFALLLYLLVRLVRIPRDVARWRRRRQQGTARGALLKGLSHLAEGSWVEAEAELLAGMRHSEAPLLNCLGAAFAAQGEGNVEKRDEYLAQAQAAAPQGALAIGMSQAFLQHIARQSELSLATLTELRAQRPRHPHILKLLAQVSLELRDWPGLVELVPSLRETQAMSAAEIDALELQAHRELLTLTLPSGSPELLKQAWKAVPKPLKRHPLLVAIYARQLIQQSEMDEAEALLRAAIDADWSDELVELYGRLRPTAPAEALDTAEAWAGSHPDSARALLGAARLALAAGQKSKARGYYEKCVALRAPAEAYRELGELMEALGDKDAALGHYRRGLELLAGEARAPATRARGVRRALR